MMASNRALKFFGVFLMTDHLLQSRTSQSWLAVQFSPLSARKLALMASVVTGLGIAVYGVSPSSGGLDIFGSPAHAQTNNVLSGVAQPQGFADLVERVKPSVISVKVTMKERVSDTDNKSDDGGSGSPMERFFRQFGGPDGVPQNPGREGRHGEMMGQGSGFFISSDGFAVTNNHVVDGADKVEVTTDAGKTYTAKVIGADPRTDVALIKVEGGADFSVCEAI
jgi:serine protease Do